MKHLKFFLVVVMLAGGIVFNAEAQMKKKPVPVPVGTVSFDYFSPVCSFTGVAALSTVNLNYQISGAGDAGTTGNTYTINACMTPNGDGSYTGSVTVCIKSGLLCIEKATGTATYLKGDNYVTLNLTSFTTPICPKI